MDSEIDLSALEISVTASPIVYQGSALTIDANTENKTNCHACGADKGDKELKKCGGCGVALYCSKECQKEAWRTHKFFCASSSTTQAIKHACRERITQLEQSLPPGYALASQPECIDSPLTGLAEFTEFMQLHNCPFITFAQAYAQLLEKGRGAEAFRRSPIVMYFVVTPSNHPKPKPWNTWKIKRWYHRQIDDLRHDVGFSQTYATIKRSFASEEDGLRTRFGSRYIGLMPIVFVVESTYMMTHSAFPIFALRDPESLQNPLACASLRDLISLCWGFVNKGMPLWGIDHFGTLQPIGSPVMVPVRYTRKELPNGTKDWAPQWLGTRQQPWDERSLRFSRTLPNRTGGNPRQLTVFFWELCHPPPQPPAIANS